jgi:hypothetical protein
MTCDKNVHEYVSQASDVIMQDADAKICDSNVMYSWVQNFKSPATQDKLDDICASDDLLEAWAEREEKMFSYVLNDLSLSANNDHGVDRDARQKVLWFMGHFVKILQLSEKSWFDAVLLLDLYCLRSSSYVEVGDLPALCAAIVRLLKKFDNGVVPNNYELEACASHLAILLRQAGHTIDHHAVTAEEIDVRETSVLQVLRYQINMPSFFSWMSIYCARINILSRQMLMPVLSSIWQHSVELARAILLHQAVDPAVCTRRIVNGLLGIGFVAVRLLPPSSLDLVGSSDFQGVFGSLLDLASIPEVAAGEDLLPDSFLEMLQAVTCSTLESLCQSSKLVLEALRSISSQNNRYHHNSI